MPGPLLETKLHVPRLRRDLVPRPRLSERLSRGAESALTLVSAPAGFGKTTLLTEWLAAAPADGRSVAWLSLDQRDNDPALFWTYLVAALQTAADGVGASALSLLQSPRRRWKRSSRPCSTTCTPSRTMSCWCSTTTTSSRRATCRTGWPSCWSTYPRRCTWSSPAAPTRPCRWRGCVGVVSSSRSAPPICASRPTKPRRTSTGRWDWCGLTLQDLFDQVVDDV